MLFVNQPLSFLAISFISNPFTVSVFGYFCPKFYNMICNYFNIFFHFSIAYTKSFQDMYHIFHKYCTYRISSNKTRGYYSFTRPSTAGIIRMRVLIEGWYYYQNFINLEVFLIKIARFLHGVIKLCLFFIMTPCKKTRDFDNENFRVSVIILSLE